MEVSNGQQAAGGGGSRGVSLGLRQDCAQADVINHLPAGVGEPYIGTELGPLLAEACAGWPIKGPKLLWGAGHCHIGKGS